jgi:hypothetical protein
LEQNPTSFKIEKIEVDHSTSLKLKLAPRGRGCNQFSVEIIGDWVAFLKMIAKDVRQLNNATKTQRLRRVALALAERLKGNTNYYLSAEYTML